MSDNNSIFNDAPAGQPPAANSGTPAGTTTTAQPNPWDNLLGAIKNERGEPKYKNAEEALIGAAHAQTYIAQLKQQLAEREEQLSSLKSSSMSSEDIEKLVQKATQKPNEEHPTKNVQIDEEGIANIVEQKLSAAQKRQQETVNQRAVADAFVQKFGADKGAEQFYSKAQELGMSKEEINALAAKSPAAVFQMLGVSGAPAHKQGFTQPPASSIRTDAFQGLPTSYIGRETHVVPLGGGNQDMAILQHNANKMVEELRSKGLSVADLENPATFFKHFK